MKRSPLLVLLLALVALASCSSQPTVVPVRNLERPGDMTFICMGISGTGDELTGRPMSRCHPPTEPDPDPFAVAPRQLGTFAFITNTARGELSVADMDVSRLVDLDPAQPGYNTVPLGVFPDVIASSQDGCQVVTVNRGSCDLTLVDPQRLLFSGFALKGPATGAGPITRTVAVTTGSGRPLATAPDELVFLPQPWELLKTQVTNENTCRPNGAYVGPNADRVPWRALVTFPACDLVAMIELPSGKIVSSAYIRPEGVVDAGVEPVCPAECGAQITPPGDGGVPPAAANDGSSDGGAGATPLGQPLRVGALAVLPDGSRVYVGAEGAPFVTALDITAGGLAAPPDGGRIPLHDNPVGVTRLRLSLDTYQRSLDDRWVGRFVGNRGEFLYAFTRDGSMRLVDVGARVPAAGAKERECDANVDPLFLGSVPHGPEKGCFLIEDSQRPSLARRPLSQGPGIRIPTVFTPDLSPPIPRDIAFANVKGTPAGVTSIDPVLSGAFGYLLASNGVTYVLSLDPESSLPNFFETTGQMNHTFLDFSRTSRGAGAPRVNVLPARNFTITEVPLPSQIPLLPLRGPRLESTTTVDQASNIAIQSWVAFPDPTAASPQTWTATWEGELPGAARLEGEMLAAGGGPGPAGALRDLGADYCDSGVQVGDEVLFPGCTQDADCLPLGTAVCRQATAGTPGLCYPKSMVTDEAFIARCRTTLGARRRYEVVAAGSRQLEMGLKLDEVPRTSLNACTPKEREEDDTECRLTPAYSGFRCLQVRPDDKPRCLQPCGTRGADGGFVKDERRCRVGTLCADVPGSQVGPLCVEAPPVDPSCWPATVSYRVQVGRGFLISGGAAPRPPVARTEGGRCVPDLSRHQFLVNRIPLDAPHCANVADGATAAIALGVIPQGPPESWGNPCLFRAPNDDEGDIPPPSRPTTPDVCTSQPCHVKALFENQQIKFVMTNLDEYAGDANISRWDVVGGFVPLTADFPEDVIVTVGVHILQGPTKTPESPGTAGGDNRPYFPYPYLYVVDQGRAASSTGGRGQVLRLNPRSGTLGIPRFDGLFTLYPFQIQ